MRIVVAIGLCLSWLAALPPDGLAQSVPGLGSGFITTYAGGGPIPKDGAPAITQPIYSAETVLADRVGGFYVSSAYLQRVYHVTVEGLISLVAGNGRAGFSGDGGPATLAKLNYPFGLALDPEGDLLIGVGGSRIRKVTPAGVISTFAGDGSSGYSGDGGPATSAKINFTSLAADAAGNVFITDYYNHRIRKVSKSGVITTVPTELSSPLSVAVDAAGNLFVLDSTRVYKITPGGVTSTVATLGGSISIAVNDAGNVFIVLYDSHRVMKVGPDGVLRVFAGTFTGGFSGDGGPAINAQFLFPRSASVNSTGELLIADSGNYRIRKVTTDGIVVTVAGNGSRINGYAGDGDFATNAALNYPVGLAMDAAGSLFIADVGNHRIRKVTPGGRISTVAGTGIRGFSGDGGSALSAELAFPSGVAVDRAGNLYIADTVNGRVRKVSPDGVIGTIADGLNYPMSVAVDSTGNVFIAETAYGRVLKVTVDGLGKVIAGNGAPATSPTDIYPTALAIDARGNLFIADFWSGIFKMSPNGTFGTVAYAYPTGVAVDGAGNIFVSGISNHIWRINLDRSLTPVAGSANIGFSGDGGPAASADIAIALRHKYDPFSIGIAVDAKGNVLFSDLYNHRIRKVSDEPDELAPGATQKPQRDFDNNGQSDVLWRDASGNVSAWLLNNNGTLTDQRIASIGTGWSISGIGDFDGDGKADILWRDLSGDVAIWLMDGTSVAGYRTIANLWTSWSIAGVGDFNGDGKSDILWRDVSGDVSIWQMDGFTVATYRRIANVAMSWTIAGVGDFDSDGKADILWRSDSGDITVWLMNGLALTSGTTVGNLAESRIAGVGDFNADGRSDILFRDDLGKVSMWLMNGDRVLATRFVSSVVTSWTIADVGDFNADGRADIFWHAETGETSVWFMDGSTILSYRRMDKVSDRTAQ